MLINLNLLLFMILILFKKPLVNGQGSYEQGSYEEMDPDSREEQIYRSKPGGELTSKGTSSSSNDPSSSEQTSAQTPDNGSQTSYDDQNHQDKEQPPPPSQQSSKPPPPPDNSAYRSPIINPYLTFNPFNLQPSNTENSYNNQAALFRQLPLMNHQLVPMQAQLFENYQLPYQQAIPNQLLYHQQMMYNLPFINHQSDQLRNYLANQQIITYEPIDDKTIEKDPYKGNDSKFRFLNDDKSFGRSMDFDKFKLAFENFDLNDW